MLGGGVILFGVDNKGESSGADVSSILSIDPATMTDKIYKYTDIQFSDFEFVVCQKGEARVAALKILPILPSEVVESQSSTATPIRIVDDLSAPAFYKIDPDESHLFRQTEAIAEVNKKLPDKYQINQYDILSARRVYNLDDKDENCYNSKFGSRQYSKEFVDWLVEQFNKDNNFFKKARREYYRITH